MRSRNRLTAAVCIAAGLAIYGYTYYQMKKVSRRVASASCYRCNYKQRQLTCYICFVTSQDSLDDIVNDLDAVRAAKAKAAVSKQ